MDASAQDQNHENSYFHDLALLDWQLELGATEAIGEVGINRFDLPEALPPSPRQVSLDKPIKSAPEQATTDALAKACNTVQALQDALLNFDSCALKQGARNLVFCDGNPLAKLMIIGAAPNQHEDRAGLPFVGPAGQLLDKMLAAIGLSRNGKTPEIAVYLTSISPWRAPQDRDLNQAEIKQLKPFLLRHIALVKPEILVILGNQPSKILLGLDQNINRSGSQWGKVENIAALAMVDPAHLLRNPNKKRAAWADLLALESRLKG